MEEAERSNVARQVEEFIQDTSEYTHSRFMLLQGRNLSTPDPVRCLNYRMLLSIMTRDLGEGDCRLTDMEPFKILQDLISHRHSHIISFEFSRYSEVRPPKRCWNSVR